MIHNLRKIATKDHSHETQILVCSLRLKSFFGQVLTQILDLLSKNPKTGKTKKFVAKFDL